MMQPQQDNDRDVAACKPAEDGLDRLCRHLGLGGAYAKADPFDPGLLRLVERRKGAPHLAGSLPAGIGNAAVASGLAEWHAGNGAPRLIATELGLARARRLAAPDGVDPFRAQHLEIVTTIANGDGARPFHRNEAESPLAWLRRRQGLAGLPIEPASFEAGERLRADLDRARMMPRVTANWAAPVTDSQRFGGDRLLAADVVIAARQRVRRALEAAGPDFAGLLIDVCGFLKGLTDIERERGWPARSAKVVLALALRRLARHYGLGNVASGPETGSRIEAWFGESAGPAA